MPDANVEQQDVLPAGGQPSTATQQPSTNETTNSQASQDAEKLVNERHSKLDKKIAEQEKELGDLRKWKADHTPLLEKAEQVLGEKARISQAEEIGKPLGVAPELLTHLKTPEEMKAHAELLAKYIKPAGTKEPFSGIGDGTVRSLAGKTPSQLAREAYTKK